jgi:prepilin-type N-terminal cleavage/methylation domain-containing protein
MTRTIARHVSGERGYSLIELLVAVGIFGLLAALGLPHLDTRRQDIQTVSKQVIADYRWARNRAITSGVHFGIEWTSTNSYQVQRMKQAANGTWSKDVTVKTVTLPSHINTTWYWPSLQEFNTRGMMVTTTYPLYQLFWDSDYYGWRMLSLWPSGQIYEEY